MVRQNASVQLIMRPPSDALRHALSEHAERDRIDPARARKQHDAYARALKEAGVAVTLMQPDPDLPDACFTWDTVLAFPRGGVGETVLLVATRPGSPSRRPEVPSVVACARKLAPGAQVAEVGASGTLDGGDVITFGDRVAIGVSARTNAEGARQLCQLLERFGYRAFLCPVEDRLHLASGVTPLGASRLIGTPSGFRSLDAAGAETVPASVERLVIDEADIVAANVLAAGGRCFVVRGFPRAVAVMERAGESVVEVDLGEFVRADGGPTCLVAPIF